jgi:hypothetical protein
LVSKALRLVLIPAFAVLSGCTTYLPPFSSVEAIPVSAMVNAVKCELNDFYVKYGDSYPGIAFAITKGKAGILELKLQTTDSAGGSIAVNNTTFVPYIPVVLASVGGGITTSSSVTADIKLVINQFADGRIHACDRPPLRAADGSTKANYTKVLINNLALSDWLYKFTYTEDQGLIAGNPKVQLDNVVLTTSFTVTVNEGAGIIQIIPMNPGPSLTASQVGLNTLTLTLYGTGPHQKAMAAGLKPTTSVANAGD